MKRKTLFLLVATLVLLSYLADGTDSTTPSRRISLREAVQLRSSTTTCPHRRLRGR